VNGFENPLTDPIQNRHNRCAGGGSICWLKTAGIVTLCEE
jgi:hypothetical protein